MLRLPFLLAVAFLLAGCASPSAGRDTGPEASSDGQSSTNASGGFPQQTVLGCQGEPRPTSFVDWAVERMWVNITAQGRATVGIATWVSTKVSAGDWTQGMELGANVDEMRLADDLEAPWLTFTGTGEMTIAFCLSHGASFCCEEDYLYGRWSLDQSGTAFQRSPMPYRLDSGSAHLSVSYEAASSYCGGRLDAAGPLLLGRGNLTVDGGFTCT